MISKSESQISWDDFQEIDKNGYLRKGDLLLTIVGSLGNSAVFETEEPVAFQRSVACLRLKRENLTRFFFYLTQSVQFQADFLARAKQSAQSGVYLGDLGSMPVTYPEPAKQRQIAEFLDHETAKIDDLIAKNQRIFDLATERRFGMMTTLLTKAAPPGLSSARELAINLPPEWTAVPLKRLTLGSLANGVFKKTGEFGAGAPIINVFDVYRDDFQIDQSALERVRVTPDEILQYRVERGDILLVRSSLKREGVGRAALFEMPFEDSVFECHLIRIRPNTQLILPAYLTAFMNTKWARDWLVAASNGVTMTTLGQDEIAGMPVIVPPVEEQQASLGVLQGIDQRTAAARATASRAITLLREYRSALISAAVTGQLDLRQHEAKLEALA
jgi:type I restriction enzyme S subunit